MITADDLLRSPSTDPTSIYRYRDGLYAADFLTAAICHLDFFNWLHSHPSDQDEICSSLGLKPRPVDVMLTLFTAMGLVRRDGPLPVAAYSALLMTITEGKCYSEQEMADFLARAGFSDFEYHPTVADRSVITAKKPHTS